MTEVVQGTWYSGATHEGIRYKKDKKEETGICNSRMAISFGRKKLEEEKKIIGSCTWASVIVNQAHVPQFSQSATTSSSSACHVNSSTADKHLVCGTVVICLLIDGEERKLD